MRANTSDFTRKGAITLARAQQALREQYGLASWNESDHRWREAIACEAIRNTIWSLWVQRGHSSESQVHRHTIQSIAMPTVRLVSDPAITWLQHKSLYDQSLKDLELLGDLEKVGPAVVAPVASRLVQMWDDNYLLVGGSPSHVVERKTPTQIRRTGPSRWLRLSRKQVDALTVLLPEQTIGSWMQRTPISLADHRKQMLDLPRNNTPDLATQDAFLAYLPERSAGLNSAAWSQRKRWHSISTIQRAWVGLISFRPPNSGYKYAIGHIENGRVLHLSEPLAYSGDSRPDTIRLFQFAEDQAAEQPFCIREIDVTTIELGSSLPEPESRLLRALAYRLRTDSEFSYPRQWRFTSSEALKFWTSKLRWMGISVRS